MRKNNPYYEFNRWLFNTIPNQKLDPEVIKAINPRAILARFSFLKNLTLFLNQYFNHYDIMSMNNEEFYYFIKSLVKKHRIKQSDLGWVHTEKSDVSMSEIQVLLPHLKKEEIEFLINNAKEHPEYEQFLDYIGKSKKIKKKKIKKKKM